MYIATEYAEELRETFRIRVLAAMDEAMNEVWQNIGVTPKDNCSGARDADLPALFPALDEQFERNVEHQGHHIGRPPLFGQAA